MSEQDAHQEDVWTNVLSSSRKRLAQHCWKCAHAHTTHTACMRRRWRLHQRFMPLSVVVLPDRVLYFPTFIHLLIVNEPLLPPQMTLTPPNLATNSPSNLSLFVAL